MELESGKLTLLLIVVFALVVDSMATFTRLRTEAVGRRIGSTVIIWVTRFFAPWEMESHSGDRNLRFGSSRLIARRRDGARVPGEEGDALTAWTDRWPRVP